MSGFKNELNHKYKAEKYFPTNISQQMNLPELRSIGIYYPDNIHYVDAFNFAAYIGGNDINTNHYTIDYHKILRNGSGHANIY